MNCPRCQTLNPAEARFCLNCGLALTRKCTACNSDLLPGARFCMHCGHPVIASTPADANRFLRVAAAAPETLAQKVLAAANLAGERRVVTILFVDVVGSTALSEQLSMDIWADTMNEAVDQIIPLIYRYEGTIARLLGDSLLAFFGAPVAHEDDPARAVRAAIEIIDFGKSFADRLRQKFGVEFALRSCINTGSVIINAVGEDLKYEFTPVGIAVDLTSRIKFAAKPMSIVVTENTHRFVSPSFDIETLKSVEVKGLERPVSIFQVNGVRPQPGDLRGIVGLNSPMVGRDVELGSLLKLCEAVRAGLGRSVAVIGEPGLGKTRLISEWKSAVEREASTHQPLWVEGRSLSYGQGLAYHLLKDMLHTILDIPQACEEQEARKRVKNLSQELFGDEMMSVYPYLANLLAIELDEESQKLVTLPDPQTLQTQYYRAVRMLLNELSFRQPIVLVLEDLHWADSSSIEIMMRLLPFINASPILFCMVTREERNTPGWRLITTAREIMGDSLTEIMLFPLSEVDSRKMVANLLEIEALPERVRKVILKRAEGNPFFVEEVIRMLIDREAIIHENGGWVACKDFDEIEIPDNLQGLLLARIDRLPEDAKMILKVASVIGRKFPVRVLEHILQEQI